MKNIIKLIILSIAFVSCNKDNFKDKFEESPSVRLKKRMTEYSEVLQNAPYGWKWSYYIDQNVMGAWHFMMKFNTVSDVEMKFELSENVINSLYTIKPEDGVVLSFDTYTFISLLADPSVDEDGSSFGGEFEYQIMSASNDSIVMRGKKTDKKTVLYPASKEEWENNFANIKNMRKKLESPTLPTKTTPDDYFIRKVKFNSGLEASETVDFMYFRSSKKIKMAYRNSAGEISVFDRALEFTHTGFKFAKPIVIKDMTLEGFDYNESSEEFTNSKNNCKIAFEKNADYLLSSSRNMFEFTWHFNSAYECSDALKPFVDETVNVLGVNHGIYLFFHPTALMHFSFRYRKEVGDSWIDWFLSNVRLDKYNNVSFIQPVTEDAKFDHLKEKGVELYNNPKVKEFVEILHDAEGWRVLEIEYQKKYRMTSKKNPDYWFILEEGIKIN